MIPKPFDEVAKKDIDDLVAEGRAERRTLEYKQTLPNLAMEQDKYEFLADVASLANAAGGDILFGVVEKRDADKKPTGIAESAPGVAIGNADAIIRPLEQSARSIIDPKVPGLQMRPHRRFPVRPRGPRPRPEKLRRAAHGQERQELGTVLRAGQHRQAPTGRG